MSKCTPGKWIAEFDGEYWNVIVEGGEGFLRDVVGCEGLFRCDGSDEANARLIAAAPDLLEACQTFSEWLRREEVGFPAETRFGTPDGEAKWREWYFENLRICDLAQTLARDAIAKATGE